MSRDWQTHSNYPELPVKQVDSTVLAAESVIVDVVGYSASWTLGH